MSAARQTVPKERYGSVVHVFGKLSDETLETLNGLESQVKPYVFLLDQANRIRWSSVGEING